MKKILIGLLVAGELFLGWGFFSLKSTPSFGAAIPIPVAFFSTSLQGSITSSDTTMTLVSGTTPDSTSLSGFYGFVIDEGSSTQEVVTCTAAATALTGCTRGISSITGNTSITALKFAHRRGATVKITTSPIVLVTARILNGNESVPNALYYPASYVASTASSSAITTKGYVDAIAIAGSPVASTVAKGIVQEATVAQVNNGTGTGSTGAKLFVSPSDIASSSWYQAIPTVNQGFALSGNFASPSATNKFLTAANIFKGAGTLSATSKLLAFTLTASAQGDILYRGASGYVNLPASASGTFLMSNGAGTNPTFSSPGLAMKSGFTTKDVSSGGTNVIAHGLGRIPKYVKITVMLGSASGSTGSTGVWNQGTTSAIYYDFQGTNNGHTEQSSTWIAKVRTNNSATEQSNAAVLTVDGTNLTLTWTLTNSPAGTVSILWEAQ